MTQSTAEPFDGLAYRRYSSVAFPRYRFVPGVNPHPTADPDGHSYLSPGEVEAWPPVPEPADWRSSEAYLFGCDLYNHAYWWEAHETWEGIWQQTDKAGVQGRFLQGLIQTSACHLKRHMGSAGGVRRLRASSRAYLEGALGSLDNAGLYMGLAVGPFIERVAHYYACVLPVTESVPPHDPASYPYIELNM